MQSSYIIFLGYTFPFKSKIFNQKSLQFVVKFGEKFKNPPFPDQVCMVIKHNSIPHMKYKSHVVRKLRGKTLHFLNQRPSGGFSFFLTAKNTKIREKGNTQAFLAISPFRVFRVFRSFRKNSVVSKYKNGNSYAIKIYTIRLNHHELTTFRAKNSFTFGDILTKPLSPLFQIFY